MKKFLCLLAIFAVLAQSPSVVYAQAGLNGPSPPLSKIRIGDRIIWPGSSASDLFDLEVLDVIDEDNIVLVATSRRAKSSASTSGSSARLPGRPLKSKPFILQLPGIGLVRQKGDNHLYMGFPTLCIGFVNYDHPQGGVIRVFVIVPTI